MLMIQEITCLHFYKVTELPLKVNLSTLFYSLLKKNHSEIEILRNKHKFLEMFPLLTAFQPTANSLKLISIEHRFQIFIYFVKIMFMKSHQLFHTLSKYKSTLSNCKINVEC